MGHQTNRYLAGKTGRRQEYPTRTREKTEGGREQQVCTELVLLTNERKYIIINVKFLISNLYTCSAFRDSPSHIL